MKSYLGVLVLGVSCLVLSLYCIFRSSLSSDSLISQQPVFSASNGEYTKSSRILPGVAINPAAAAEAAAEAAEAAPKAFGEAQRNKILKRSKSRQQWTPDEDALLLDLREGREMSWTEVAEHFPTRTLGALQVRIKRLKRDEVGGMRRKKLDYWTPQEDGRLLKLVEKGLSADQIANRFSKRNLNSIKSHYYYLTGESIEPSGRGKKFTAEEDELLLRLSDTDLTFKEKAKFFENRSEKSITSRHYKLMGEMGARDLEYRL